MKLISCTSRKAFLVFYCLCVIFLLVVFLNFYSDKMHVGGNSSQDIEAVTGTEAQSVFYKDPPENNMSKYILDTEHCKIPRTKIMAEQYEKYWTPYKNPDCTYEKQLSTISGDQVLQLLPEYQDSRNCCIQEILRHPELDSYTLSDCENVEVDVDISSLEMYLLRCNTSLNFGANFPINPQVKKKIKYWTKKKSTDLKSLPFSVTIIGIDTVSRSHAFRGMPRVVPFMKEMGFVDFQAYHSLAPSTLTMFMAFLGGMSRDKVRATCAPTWTTPFDNCSFIWRNYDRHNYVTMYVEDGPQSFNWGGQSGFRKKPTDFYIHPLFNAMEEVRLKNFPDPDWLKKLFNTPVHTRLTEMQDYCTSNETVPQFLLRYTKRFIQKFHQTPFFSFTWFAYPFHDDGYALRNFEADLLKLFQYLNSVPSILRDTLIIFTSDHGDRGADLNQFMELEEYLERGLPPLFIRLPDRLRDKFPEKNLDQVLRRNAEQLVTPFDLHHTLLHLLHLSGLGKPRFIPYDVERASLFIPVDKDNIGLARNCRNLNIAPEACVCDVLIEEEEKINSPYYLGRIADLLQRRLRTLVVKANYSSICAKWEVKTRNILRTRVIGKENSSTVNLVRFEANPGKALFEAKIRVLQSDSKFDRCRVIGKISRLSLYGEQSSCVGYETDLDKEMKEFCMCKSKVPDSFYVHL